jgi:hypothetical protein
MPFTKVQQAWNTWRLFHAAGTPIGRIWNTAHVDRLVRDAQFADAIVTALSQSGATRRQLARTAFQVWVTAGGRDTDFSGLTFAVNEDDGQPNGNLNLFLGGMQVGYLHGVDAPRDEQLQRIVRLSEEAWSAEEQGTAAARNAALDVALNRFRDDGGLG